MEIFISDSVWYLYIDPNSVIFSKHWHKQKEWKSYAISLEAIKGLHSVACHSPFTIHHQKLADTLKVTIENTVILRDGIVPKSHSRTIAEWFKLGSIFRDEFFFQLQWRRFVSWGVSRRWGDGGGWVFILIHLTPAFWLLIISPVFCKLKLLALFSPACPSHLICHRKYFSI